VERHRLQLVHQTRARLHHPVPVPQQLPQIPILPARYPDLRKAIFEQQSQNQLRILAIRLLLAYPLRADLRCVPDPQLKLQLGEQPLKPACMPARLHPHAHPHSLCREITVELLRFLAMLQSRLLQFPSFGIHKSNLLEARVIVCSYNDHCSAPFSRAFLVGLAPPKFTRAWEPTLSWNQLRSKPLNERYRDFAPTRLIGVLRLFGGFLSSVPMDVATTLIS